MLFRSQTQRRHRVEASSRQALGKRSEQLGQAWPVGFPRVSRPAETWENDWRVVLISFALLRYQRQSAVISGSKIVAASRLRFISARQVAFFCGQKEVCGSESFRRVAEKDRRGACAPQRENGICVHPCASVVEKTNSEKLKAES